MLLNGTYILWMRNIRPTRLPLHDTLSATQQNQFSTLSILALTSGSLVMVFFVLCVDQLTRSSRELHTADAGIKSVGARFYGCKYLFALLVLGISSSALMADGVIAFMRMNSLTPGWMNMPMTIGTGILAFASWSFVLVVIVIGILEFRLRPYIAITRSSRNRNRADGQVRLDSRQFSRLKSDMRMVARGAQVTTALAVICCFALWLAGTLSENNVLLLLPPLVAAALVVNAMFYSGLISLFFLQNAAFAVVTNMSVKTEAPRGTRLYLLAKQLEDPHRGMWIFPGGFIVQSAETDPISYICEKLRRARIAANVDRRPLAVYRHLMPEEEIAYRGALYEAAPIGEEFDNLPHTADSDNVFCALAFEQMTSDLVPDLILGFVEKWEQESTEQWERWHPEP